MSTKIVTILRNDIHNITFYIHVFPSTIDISDDLLYNINYTFIHYIIYSYISTLNYALCCISKSSTINPEQPSAKLPTAFNNNNN